MPIYAYRCRDCGHQFDIRQTFAEDSLTICPVCEGSIRRVIQPIGVVFKGTGFYINDSKSGSSSSKDKDKSRPAAESADSSSSDSGSGEKTDKSAKSDGASGKTEGGSTEKVAAEKTGSAKSEPVTPSTRDKAPAAAKAASK